MSIDKHSFFPCTLESIQNWNLWMGIETKVRSENLLITSVQGKSPFLWFIITNYGELIFSPKFAIQNYGGIDLFP